MAALEGYRVGQKSSYRLHFWQLNSSCTGRSIAFNVSELQSNNFSFQWQNSMTDISVALRTPCCCPSEGHQHGVSIQSSINLNKTVYRKTRQ